MAGIDQITEVASEIVGSEVTSDDIGEKMGIDDSGNIAIDTTELPSKIKHTVDDEIDVKFPSTASERIVKDVSDDGVKISISGSDIDTKILDR
ncbi:hypothetical protein [Halorubrum distributum]|uniref:hypothetical protein n=1 Tax=Halorubrum distributum TaxID=29283 RepID=UPI001268805B|nr:hypothetical protein [Halorubrum arcis]